MQSPNPQKLIFLAGFMGSGKSTIGPILANTLGFEFMDMDRVIEQQTGKSVVTIFQEQGESAFRETERKVLNDAVRLHNHVISLGGGTLANEENLNLLKRHGVIIYLHISPEGILQRVQHKTNRPLLTDDEGNKLSLVELQERIEKLLSVREKYFEQSHIIVSTEKRRLGMTVDEIVKRLRGKI